MTINRLAMRAGILWSAVTMCVLLPIHLGSIALTGRTVPYVEMALNVAVAGVALAGLVVLAVALVAAWKDS